MTLYLFYHLFAGKYIESNETIEACFLGYETIGKRLNGY